MFSLHASSPQQRAKAGSQSSQKQQQEPSGAPPKNSPHFFTEAQPFPVLQPSLSIGQPNDRYEQEAEAVATAVVSNRPVQPILGGGRISSVQRESTNNALPAPANLKSQLSRSQGSGGALPAATRGSMETAIGANFSHVRIHTGTAAAQMNRDLGARAFTHGPNIYFNAGEYQPNSRVGRHLLAHELTHVVQQAGGRTPSSFISMARLPLTAKQKREERRAKSNILKAIKKMKSVNPFFKDKRQVELQNQMIAILSKFQSVSDIGTKDQLDRVDVKSKYVEFQLLLKGRPIKGGVRPVPFYLKLFVSHDSSHGEVGTYLPKDVRGGDLVFNAKMASSGSVDGLVELMSHEMVHMFSHTIRMIEGSYGKGAAQGLVHAAAFNLLSTDNFGKHKQVFKKHFTKILAFLNAQKHHKNSPLPKSLIDDWIWLVVEEKIANSYEDRVRTATSNAKNAAAARRRKTKKRKKGGVMEGGAPTISPVSFLDKYLIRFWLTNAKDKAAMRSKEGKALMKAMTADVAALHQTVEKQLGK